MRADADIINLMQAPPSLDAHAHFDPCRASAELADAGAVLGMTLSLDEADKAAHREEPMITWRVGCHPRKATAQYAFDADRFSDLARNAASQMSTPIQKVELKTSREARTISPSAYGVFGVMYEDQLLSYRPMGGKTLRQMLENSNG